MNKEGDLKVWWIPQVPGKAFEVPVKSPEEAILIMDTLAQYDIFQLENNIKPDYCNAGGLNVFEDGDWSNWYHPETDKDIDEWKNSREEPSPQSQCKTDGCNADYLKDTWLRFRFWIHSIPGYLKRHYHSLKRKLNGNNLKNHL